MTLAILATVIGPILGVTAVVTPVLVHRDIPHKGENDLALGNVIGSTLFNTRGVVRLAGVISPAVMSTDLVMRLEGALLVAAYLAHATVIFATV